MNMHITILLTTCADGRYCVPGKQLEGAPPPLFIVSDASSAEEMDSLCKSQRQAVLLEMSELDEIELPGNILAAFFGSDGVDDDDPHR